LVGVARGRDAGADVEELADPLLTGQAADHAAEERAVGAGGEDGLGGDLEHRFGGRPVSRVIVLAAEQEIIHTGLVRHASVEWQRPAGHWRFATRPDHIHFRSDADLQARGATATGQVVQGIA
jgi:hypothetical protein